MGFKQCANGHFYNEEINNSCPYCESEKTVNETIFVDDFRGETQFEFTGIVDDAGKTQFGSNNNLNSDPDDNRTQIIIKEKMGNDPIVGWLVCVDGAEKGKDYRVHTDNNYIGRADNMDICVRGDDTISRENHAVISYDMKNKTFYFSPSSGRSIVRHNDAPVFATVQINAYDDLEIGETKFKFIPFCGEAFSWLD